MAADRRRSPSAVRPASAAPSSPAPTRPELHVIHGGRPGAAKIRDVRARILAGYYDRLDVRSRLADAVLRQMRRS